MLEIFFMMYKCVMGILKDWDYNEFSNDWKKLRCKYKFRINKYLW